MPTTVEITEAIAKQMKIFFQPGDVIELRALKPTSGYNQTASGYFNNVEDFAKEAAKIDGKYEGIYFTLNPVNPELLARAKNKVKQKANLTTSDKDIAFRAWILIDIDPVRATGISSTDEQHKLALERAYRIVSELLESLNFDFTYVVASSGNGAHVLIRIHLPNDNAHTELISEFLNYIGLQYTDTVCDIDLKVFNAARICKVYGTLACKGDHTDERPHRKAKILKVHRGQRLPIELIQGIAERLPKQDDCVNESNFDLEEFIKKNDIEVLNKKKWNDGDVYLIPCPWNPEHKKDGFVGKKADGTLFAGCFHNSCKGKQWHDFRLHYEPKAYDGVNTAEPGGNGKTKKNFWLPIAKQFCQKYFPFTCNDILYIYKDGYYTSKSVHIKSEINSALGTNTSIHARAEIEGYVRLHKVLYVEQLNPFGNELINVENGMLDWKRNELKPHDPKFLSTIRIPVKYDPEADCPTVERFLQKLLPNLIDYESGELPLVYEIFGTAITSNKDYKTKALMCYGPPGTGKSQFQSLLLKFVGVENSCSLSIQQIAEDKFACAQLFGKLLNAADDISNRMIIDTEDLKKSINPTQLRGQFKHKDSFFFVPFCTHIFSCNELPTPKDKTGGFWDRWIIVRFTVRVRDTSEQVQNYAEKIATPAELSGLLNRSIRGLQRVATQNRFSITEEVKEALDDYREQSDPIVSFIKEMCVLNSKAKVGKHQIYNTYKKWCEDNSLRPFSTVRFYRHIKDCFPGIQDARMPLGDQRCRAFVGIGMLDEYHTDPVDEEFDDDDHPRYDDIVLPF